MPTVQISAPSWPRPDSHRANHDMAREANKVAAKRSPVAHQLRWSCRASRKSVRLTKLMSKRSRDRPRKRYPRHVRAPGRFAMREHGVMTDSLSIRRVDGDFRRFRSLLRRPRLYEVRYPSGERQVVTLHALDSMLNARAAPGDFWSCVGAADAAFARGETEALFEWPSGRRADRA